MLYHRLRFHVSPKDGYNDAWCRTLNRLDAYTQTIVEAMNMRPKEIHLLSQSPPYILVRIEMPHEYVLLRIAPGGDLARERYFGRTMVANHLPAARILHYDASRTLVPFDYILEQFVGGTTAERIDDPSLQRAIARQVGRVLRRMHRVTAPGWGRPGSTGRWNTSSWDAALTTLHTRLAPPYVVSHLFDSDVQAAVEHIRQRAATSCSTPVLMHGALHPGAVRCTIGLHVHLEALADPGMIVAGDGLLDLAHGLEPTYPEPWRTGLMEGYVSSTPLPDPEIERVRWLQILTGYWSACQKFLRAEPYHRVRDQTLAWLETVSSV
jgi:hypothetical protein